jgi:hypothetical protein
MCIMTCRIHEKKLYTFYIRHHVDQLCIHDNHEDAILLAFKKERKHNQCIVRSYGSILLVFKS